MIFKVVLTPTSDVTNTSSKLSNTSSSMVDLPMTALVILEKNPSLVFSRPLSRACCASGVSCFFLKKSNKPMYYLMISSAKYVGQIYLNLAILKKPFRCAYQNGFFIFLKKNFKKGISCCLF